MTNLEQLNNAGGITATAEEMAIGILVLDLVETLIDLSNIGEMPKKPSDIDGSQYIQQYFANLKWLGEEAAKV